MLMLLIYHVLVLKMSVEYENVQFELVVYEIIIFLFDNTDYYTIKAPVKV